MNRKSTIEKVNKDLVLSLKESDVVTEFYQAMLWPGYIEHRLYVKGNHCYSEMMTDSGLAFTSVTPFVEVKNQEAK